MEITLKIFKLIIEKFVKNDINFLKNILSEKYLCYTHELNDESYTLPIANRSDYFWRDSEVLACSTNEHSVPCWIPKSRMKSYGLLLMYTVLIVNFLLSCLELIYFFTFDRKKFEKKKI